MKPELLNSPKELARFFAVATTTSAMLIAVLTPPFQSPDEPNHFFRAFQISEGRWLGAKQGNLTGEELPVTLSEDIQPFYGQFFRPGVQLSFAEWKLRFEYSHPQTLGPSGRTEFVSFPNTSLYSPLPYAPQALAIFIGRIFHAKTLSLFYLARVASLIASCALLYGAFNQLAFSRRLSWAVFVLAATPVFSFLTAMSGADGLTLSLSTLVTSLAVSLSREWKETRFICFLAASAGLGLCKGTYFLIPLAILPTLVFSRSIHSFRQRCIKALLVFSSALIPFAAWSVLVKPLYNPAKSGGIINPAGQIQYVMVHKAWFVGLVLKTFKAHPKSYLDTMIGCMGWLDTSVLNQIVLLQIAALVCIPVLCQKKTLKSDPRPARMVVTETSTYLAIFVVSVLIISIAMYMSWNPVGSASLEGLQGRYFLPLIPLLLISIPPWLKLSSVKYGYFELIFALIWAVVSISTWGTLINRYWSRA